MQKYNNDFNPFIHVSKDFMHFNASAAHKLNNTIIWFDVIMKSNKSIHFLSNLIS